MSNASFREFPLGVDEYAEMQRVVQRIKFFPAELRQRARIPLSLLELNGLYWYTVTGEVFVASAYYGLYLLPPTYAAWASKIANVYRVEVKNGRPPRDADGREIEFDHRRNPRALQNEAAKHWSAGGRLDFESFYAHLDLVSKHVARAPLEALYDTRRFVEHVKSRHHPIPSQLNFSDEEMDAFAKGPAWIWEYAVLAKNHPQKNIVVCVDGPWIIAIRNDGDIARALVMDPTALRQEAFQGSRKITSTARPQVGDAVERLARTHFPDCRAVVTMWEELEPSTPEESTKC